MESAKIDLKARYARIGPWYDLLDAPWERLRYRHIRPVVWREVAECPLILDAGCGTGRNIAYYPAGARVVGVDLSWQMVRRASSRLDATPARANLILGNALALPFQSAAFDAVVSTFLFCVLPDEQQPQALREIARVLRPGGKAVLLEYQYSANGAQRALMRMMAPWVEWAYGARFDRETSRHLLDGKWRICDERFLSKDIVKLIVAECPDRKN